VFVGHYGVSFAAKPGAPRVPLWVLFLAVQFLDVLWAPFVLIGLEKVDIVPGITATNPLDLYYMPYSHSLLAAVFWSIVAALVWRAVARGRGGALVVGGAVFSHWILDLVVHRPDLALYDDAVKVGLGLWNHPVPALLLEAGLMVAGLAYYLRSSGSRPLPWIVLGAVLLLVHVISFFGAPPTSAAMAAWMALGAYVVLAAAVAWLEHRAPSRRAAA
jgi:hypothetical protein